MSSDEDEGADPFEDLADMADEEGADPFEDLAEEDSFDQPGSEFDEDAIWDQLTAEEAGGSEVEEEDGDGAADVADAADAAGAAEANVTAEEAGPEVVDKEKFCQRCEHFSEPPEVRCTYQGSEISEVVDADHFRVVNCPIVAQRREVGELE